MQAALRMRQYQQQAIASASPEQLIAKLYDLAVGACHSGDREKLRSVLKELISSLNFDQGGDIAQGLYNIYEYCLRESLRGDLEFISELMDELRSVWKESVMGRKAA